MKPKTEHVILSVAGGLATLVLGYLVWRHERKVTQQDAAQNQANTQADDAALEQQLAQELTAIPSYASSGGSGYYGNETETGVAPSNTTSDSNIAAILSAFFPNAGTSTGTTSGGSTMNPTTGQPPGTMGGSPGSGYPVATGGGGSGGPAQPVDPSQFGGGSGMDPTTGQPPGFMGSAGGNGINATTGQPPPIYGVYNPTGDVIDPTTGQPPGTVGVAGGVTAGTGDPLTGVHAVGPEPVITGIQHLQTYNEHGATPVDTGGQLVRGTRGIQSLPVNQHQ